MLIFGLHFCGVFEEIIIEVVIVEFHLEPKAPAIKLKLMEVRGVSHAKQGPWAQNNGRSTDNVRTDWRFERA